MALGVVFLGEPFDSRMMMATALVSLPSTTNGVMAARAALAALMLAVPATGAAQGTAAPGTQPAAATEGKAATVLSFIGGAVSGLGAHEGSHLLFNAIFDADPGLKRIDFHGVPFFAIRHEPLSPVREFVVSSAGFWAQHAGSEWLLTTRPLLRYEHGPFAKGLLAFNIGASVAYATAAFARGGPAERDTLSIALSADIDERWVGALILAPAVLDGWRYLKPESKWAAWTSRAVKAAGVLLIFRAARTAD